MSVLSSGGMATALVFVRASAWLATMPEAPARRQQAILSDCEPLPAAEHVSNVNVFTAGGLAGVAAAAALALNVLPAAVDMFRVIAFPAYGNGLAALVATACAVPLHLRHVIYGLRGERPAGAMWTLAALALVNAAGVAAVGVGLVPSLALLAVSVLLVVRRPWAVPLAAAVVLSAWALAGSSPTLSGPYAAITVTWRSVTLFVVVWLVAALWQLEGARRELRDRVVVRERLRIQTELRRTVGSAFEDIISRAGRAAATTQRDAARMELQGVVDLSRQTLAHARLLVAGYRETSVRAELEAAVALLEAARVEPHISVADERELEATDARSRAAVRLAAAKALREDSLARCFIDVSRDADGELRVLVSSGNGSATHYQGSP